MILEENDLMFCTGSYDRLIKVFIIRNVKSTASLNEKEIVIINKFKHRGKIQEIDWDPFNTDRLLNTCQNNATV